MNRPQRDLPQRLRKRLRAWASGSAGKAHRDSSGWWMNAPGARPGAAVTGPRPAAVDEFIDPATAPADHFCPGFPARLPFGPQVLFFDLETTGLGHADCIFLAGMLWPEGGGLRLRQEFARDVTEERALLDHIVPLLAAHPVVVTYNGIGFDLPFVRRRLRYHALPALPDDLQVVDLLFAVRRHAAGSWPDCRLGTAEQRLLRKQRTGPDIPGAEVPARFFEYLATGHTETLAPIIYHNRIDLTSLAALHVVLDGGD